MKRKPLLIVAGLAGLVMLLAVCGPTMAVFMGGLARGVAEGRAGGAEVDSTAAGPTAAVERDAEPTATLTLPPKDRLERDLLRLLGESNREVNGGRKLTAVDFFEDEGNIGVTWALDDHFTPGMVLSLGKGDAATILQALTESGVPFRTATLAGTFTIEDAAGDVAETVVVQATYDAGVLRGIDWDTFNEAAVFRAPLARGVYIHPEMGE